MHKTLRFAASFLLVIIVFQNNLPITEACGPGFLTPVFDYKYAPENPFDDFARGKIGILKPSYHRVVLFAAYRYLNNGSFAESEQRALVDVWKADFNNKDFRNEDVAAAVKLWVERRKDSVSKEEKLPEIYTEREYGGYDFFPNCTKNAFETAAQTLNDRATSHGSDTKDVKDWVAGQDAVFTNCTSGKQMPAAANGTMPEWLQKDRAYQTAAAKFYALDYDQAKNDFAEIAKDNSSPWRETAEYLVARTLIRQASLSGDAAKQNIFYAEAEDHLQRIAATGSKFADSSEQFMNLVKYRLRPQERVGELAQKLSLGNVNDNFRQDLIDYYWLLDKVEKETLEAEQKRKEAEKANENGADAETSTKPEENNIDKAAAEKKLAEEAEQKTKLSITLTSEDSTKNQTIYVSRDASDDEAIAEAEKVWGEPLSEKLKENIRNSKKYAYANFYSSAKRADYEGGYYGEEKTSLAVLPEYLRRDDLTEWLFTYQIKDLDAYAYAVSRFKQTGADLWLMTALSKADKNSAELKNLLDAAGKIGESSPAYATVAYHKARILLEQDKQAEARKSLNEILDSSIDLPVSTRNQFLELRLKLAQSMDDFLRDALPKPFAFDSDGQSLTLDELIEQEKGYYNPEFDKDSREDYERAVEERYRNEKMLEGQRMLDEKSIRIINEHFPLSVLLEARQSAALPDYLKDRFALAIWTRALILGDWQTANRVIIDVQRLKPDSADLIDQFKTAKTPIEKQNAALFIILKDEQLSPYIAGGFGTSWESFGSGGSRWWCMPYDQEFDTATNTEQSRQLSTKPKFLNTAQSAGAQAELKRLKTLGDAPKYLGAKVLDWARRAPLDKRVPASLYIVYEANGWDKYGCGNDEELRIKIGNLLKKRYPDNEWTQRMEAAEDESN